MEWYLLHGEREFIFYYNKLPAFIPIKNPYIQNVEPVKCVNGKTLSHLTPKALKYLKNG